MAGNGRSGAKDDMHISQRTLSFIEARPGNVSIAVVVIDPLEKGEEDAAVGGEVWIQSDIKNAELRRRGHGGKPGERGGQDALLVEDPHRARQFFSDENFSVGQECQRPRRVQGADKRGDGEGCGRVKGGAGLFGEGGFVVGFFWWARFDRLAFRRGVGRKARSPSGLWGCLRSPVDWSLWVFG